MTRGLLIIDIQRDYFPGGAYPLVGPEPAAAAAGRVLETFRAGGEPVIEKASPNGFVGTGLADELRSRGIDELVVAGMMSSMCVDATVRAAADAGFAVTVVHDACAAPDLAFGGVEVAGAAVHAAFMAALADGYATVVDADRLAEGSTTSV